MPKWSKISHFRPFSVIFGVRSATRLKCLVFGQKSPKMAKNHQKMAIFAIFGILLKTVDFQGSYACFLTKDVKKHQKMVKNRHFPPFSVKTAQNTLKTP